MERLAALDVDVEVLPLAPRLRDVRRNTVRVGAFDPRALLPLPGYVLRLAQRLRVLRPDIIHTNSLKAALYAGVAGRLVGIPVVWHVRDRISDDYLPTSAVHLVRAAARVLPTAVLANSHATLATLPRVRRSGVLYNPVVPDAVEPRDSFVRPPARNLTVGILGRLSPAKGQHTFLEAFAAAFGGTAAQARVIGSAMFGEDEYAAWLRTRAEELGITRQVEFRGFREDIWTELAALDILAHCSTAEGFGQVVLEGMAAGLAVIATDSGGPGELIANGVEGLLIPPDDVAALVSSLERLRDDPVLRSKLGEAARVRSNEFTPARTAEQLLAIYATVLT